jgi:hypothetical protein
MFLKDGTGEFEVVYFTIDLFPNSWVTTKPGVGKLSECPCSIGVMHPW